MRIDTVDKMIEVNMISYRSKTLRLNNFQNYLLSFIKTYISLSNDISQKVNTGSRRAGWRKLDELRKSMKRQIWELDNKCEKSIPWIESQQEEFRDYLKKVEATVEEVSAYLKEND